MKYELPALTLFIGLLLSPPTTQAADDNAQATRLRITNERAEPICIQQASLHHTQDPLLVRLNSGEHYDYTIPDEGLAATRFWAKTGCKDDCTNCTIGESSVIPGLANPKAGTQPAIDSKFEATWGCLDNVSDENCAVNPSSDTAAKLPHITSWDASGVDGFTLPFKVIVKNSTGTWCKKANSGKEITSATFTLDCSTLDPQKNCPAAEDLSQAYSGDTKYQEIEVDGHQLSAMPLQYLQDKQNAVGCFSPCSKLTSAQDQGLRNRILTGIEITPDHDLAKKYCCPAGVSSADCTKFHTQQGIGINYRTALQKSCQIYSYAYDDDFGLINCPAAVQYEVIFTAAGTPSPTKGCANNAPKCDDGLCPENHPNKKCPFSRLYQLGLPATLTNNQLFINGKVIDWQAGQRTIKLNDTSFTVTGPNSNCEVKIIDEQGHIKSTGTGNCQAIVSPDGKTIYFPADL